AGDPFKELQASGWKPTPEMAEPENYPIAIKAPAGAITIDGTRRNTRMLLEYLERWLRGRGANGIDSLAGRTGVHPALMEDLPTARISVAQIAQRLIHAARDAETNRAHDFGLVKQLLQEQLGSILDLLGNERDDATETRYRKAYRIALRWIRNYTE